MQKNCFCLPLFVCEEVCVYVHQCVREYIVLVTYLMTQAINLTDDSFMQEKKKLKDIIKILLIFLSVHVFSLNFVDLRYQNNKYILYFLNNMIIIYCL